MMMDESRHVFAEFAAGAARVVGQHGHAEALGPEHGALLGSAREVLTGLATTLSLSLSRRGAL